MVLRIIIGFGIAAFLGLAAHAAETAELKPSPYAMPPERAPLILVQDSCANLCQRQHDQCRVQTKGSPSCDRDRQLCLQGCIAKKTGK